MLILYDIDINKNDNINADTIKYIFSPQIKKTELQKLGYWWLIRDSNPGHPD